MTAPTRAEVEQAIARIEKSRLSHVQWANFFERWPEEEAKYEDTVGSRERNLRVTAEYDQVLDVLRRIAAT